MAACPACGKNNFIGSQECKFCGVVFKKWSQHVKQKQELGLSPGEMVACESKADLARKRQMLGLGIGFALLLLGFIFHKYFTVTLDSNEMGFPFVEDGKWGFINAKGQQVIRPRFDAAERFSEGLAAVMVGKEWFYINTQGKKVIPPRYDKAGAFREGYALARLISGYWEIIDIKGKSVGTTNFDPIGRKGGLDISTFHNGLAVAENLYQKKLFINKSGNAVGGVYEDAKDFSEGLAAVRKGGVGGAVTVWSYVKPDGSDAFPFSFLRAGSFSEGIAPAEKVDGRKEPGMGYIDRSGDYILRPQYSDARPFHFGLAWVVTSDGLCGAIDRVGRMVFQVGCSENRGDFTNRMAWISKPPDNKYGVLDQDGTLIFRPAFSTPPEFNGGLAFVSIYNRKGGGEAGYIDRWGNFVWKISLKKVRSLLSKDGDFERKFNACHMGEQLVIGAKK